MKKEGEHRDVTALIAMIFVVMAILAPIAVFVIPYFFPATADFFITEPAPTTYEEWYIDQSPRSR